MSGWRLVTPESLRGQWPHILRPACHDGSPEITIQCDCGNVMHYHESLISSAPPGAGIGGRCLACGDILEFEPETFAVAFAEMRRDGWLERFPSTETHHVCPGCGRISFLLCKGGCSRNHVHDARCLYCKYRWKIRSKPHPMTCWRCGTPGRETLDDSNPGVCADCHRAYLQELMNKLPGMVETYPDDPSIVAAWAREFLTDEAGMPPDWADVLAASMLAGRNYLEA